MTMCSCDGPPHPWDLRWCPPSGPKGVSPAAQPTVPAYAPGGRQDPCGCSKYLGAHTRQSRCNPYLPVRWVR